MVNMIMKFAQIVKKLLEAKQVGLVYHFTSLDGLIKILLDDKLKAYNASRLDILTVSTTRNRNYFTHRFRKGDYSKPFTGNHAALELDGTKMSSNFQTKPHHDAVSDSEKSAWGDEMEQIWYGDKIHQSHGITGITKYITKIILIKKMVENVLTNNFTPHAYDMYLEKKYNTEEKYRKYLELPVTKKLELFVKFLKTITKIEIELQ